MDAYNALAPYYDELTADVPYESFADFYERIFQEYGCRPTMLLDLGCGTGTLTRILARRGYEMIGVDASAEMLSVAMERTGEGTFNPAPLYLCQTMEELDLYGTVSAAVCSLDGLNYVPPESLSEVFHRLRLFVEPGGLVIFDVNTPSMLRGLDGEIFLDEREDVYCIWRGEFDEELGALVYGMDLFERAEDGLWLRDGEEHIEYAHTRELLVDALTAQGFEDIAVYGELELREPREGEKRIFIAARREW